MIMFMIMVVMLMVMMMVMAAIGAASFAMLVMMVIMAVVMMMIVRLQKIRLMFQNFVQIKAAEAKDLVQRHIAALRMHDLGKTVDGANLAFHLLKLIRFHKVGLIEN